MTGKKQKKTNDTAHVLEGYHCKDCGWPIIDACCNDSFETFKDAADWEWWRYCSNKGCANHEGEGIFMSPLSWVIKD